MRFGAVASAVEAMVWESETDGNPSVDADESILHTKRRVDRTLMTDKEVHAIICLNNFIRKLN